ncbi:MAG TPA: hypothetical protein VMT34_07390 [Aggregatilineales bacterium]|nr:hypothetical protein [Aggregatilineales bacterium]
MRFINVFLVVCAAAVVTSCGSHPSVTLNIQVNGPTSFTVDSATMGPNGLGYGLNLTNSATDQGIFFLPKDVKAGAYTLIDSFKPSGQNASVLVKALTQDEEKTTNANAQATVTAGALSGTPVVSQEGMAGQYVYNQSGTLNLIAFGSTASVAFNITVKNASGASLTVSGSFKDVPVTSAS